MKKVYSLLTLMLFCMAGVVQAQSSWDMADEPLKEITPGQTVVLQEGTYASWSQSGLLNSAQDFSTDKMSTTLNDAAVWKFIEKGKTSDGLTTYVLLNVGNGRYLTTSGYTKSMDEAFECTALLAEYKGDDVADDITAYRNAIHSRQQDMNGEGFVFCSVSQKLYIGYYYNPSFMSYSDTNCWYVYEVTEHQMTARELFDNAFEDVFTVEVTTENYPVGTTPGRISEEVYEEFSAVYQRALAAQADNNVADDDLKALTADIRAIWAKVGESRVQVVPGYYLMISQRSQDAAYDRSGQAYCTLSWTRPEEPTVDNFAKYVWQVEEIDSKLYLKNFATGRYLGAAASTSATYPMTDEAEVAMNIPYLSSIYFRIQDANGNYAHCAGGANIVWWNSTGEGNQWEFVPVAESEIAGFKETVERNQLLDKLNSLIVEGENTTTKYMYDTDCTMDDQYADAGLVSTFEGANATETSEGTVEGAFDGNLTTYYHTMWSAAPQDGDYDWVQVDLGKEVQNIFVKLTQRHNNRYGNPSRIALVTEEDVAATVWTDTLCTDTVIYQYATNYPAGKLNNTTAVMRIDLGKPVQHLRFVVTRTPANQIHGDVGPCWHVAELRFYEDRGDNPRYALIPQSVKDNLTNVLATARQEAADSVPTQATCDALAAAIAAFDEAYPDPSTLNALLEEAAAQAEAAEAGTEMGYFEEGAKEELQAVVTKLQAEAEKVLTLEQIKAYEAEIREAVSTFLSKLIGPADGSFYFIKSVTSKNEDITNSFISANNVDLKSPLTWVKDDSYESNLNLFWQAKKNDNGTYSFRNVATGRYIGNLYKNDAEVKESTAIVQSETADEITLASAKVGGQFLFQLAEGHYFNTDANSGNIVTWYESDDENARFVLQEIDAWDGMCPVTVSPKKLQIVSLPFAVSGLDVPAYEVVGLNGNEVQLSEIDGGVAPGTPFVIDMREEGDDATFIYVVAETEDLNEFINGTYAYAPVNKNGLVSALVDTKPGANIGLLIDNVIKQSDDDDVVAAGTGYFSTLPATDVIGDLSIALDGEFVIDAINNAVVARNAASDVYTLAGVKVRQNVQGAAALQGLPKGVYIVGGKKVIVK